MDLRSSKVIGMARNLRSAWRNRWSASPEWEPVDFADLERPAPEVREDAEMADFELDDDDVARRVRGIGHERWGRRNPPSCPVR